MTPLPPADDQHSRQWRAQNGRRGYRGIATGEAQRPSAPRTTGRGITASALQTPLDNRSTSQAGRARDWRETAGSGRVSGAMVHLLKHMLCWEHDGVTAITGPPPTRPDDRPTLRAVGIFDVCSNAAVNSDLSCFLYRGRMKRPYLHCRADSVA